MPRAPICCWGSGPNLLTGEDIRTMNPGPMVFALSNPTPEVPLRIGATRRLCDRPVISNQINNVLCFPVSSRACWTRASRVTREMLTAIGAIAWW